MYTNLNILQKEECQYLFKNLKTSDIHVHWNKEYEICAGKKHKFPNAGVHFLRQKKTRSEKIKSRWN